MRLILMAIALSISSAVHAYVEDFTPADSVLVDKSDRKLYLIKNGEPYREYSIALGFHPVGHKKKEGDGKTPEGLYTLDWRNPNSRFYRAIHISYPSVTDLEHANSNGDRPGGMIMIHGYPDASVFNSAKYKYRGKDWTDGCIAVNNDAMDEIWQAVSDGTQIEIRK